MSKKFVIRGFIWDATGGNRALQIDGNGEATLMDQMLWAEGLNRRPRLWGHAVPMLQGTRSIRAPAGSGFTYAPVFNTRTACFASPLSSVMGPTYDENARRPIFE